MGIKRHKCRSGPITLSELWAWKKKKGKRRWVLKPKCPECDRDMSSWVDLMRFQMHEVYQKEYGEEEGFSEKKMGFWGKK